MSVPPVVVDLRGASPPARPVAIPGAAPAVYLARLHVDPATRASVSLVRFPPGWTRPGAGHYDCAELFVVLAGALQVSGVRYATGEYGYLPAGSVRTGSHSGDGCLAVAWFSGAPRWSPGAPGAPAVPVAEPVGHGRLGEGDPPAGAATAAYGRDAAPAEPVAVPTELLWVGSGQWCLLPPGAAPPSLPGPVLVRPWPTGAAG